LNISRETSEWAQCYSDNGNLNEQGQALQGSKNNLYNKNDNLQNALMTLGVENDDTLQNTTTRLECYNCMYWTSEKTKGAAKRQWTKKKKHSFFWDTPSF